MTDIADRYRELADAFETRLAAVRPDQWTDRTPCAEWDVRGLVGHVVEVHGMLLAPLEQAASPAPPLAEDPRGAFAAARRDVESVLDDPARAGTEFDGVFGRTRVDATIDQFLGFDLVVHGWDLARATGQDERMLPGHVERVWALAEGFGDNLRRPGICGPEVAVPADAPLRDRLLGRLGRDPY